MKFKSVACPSPSPGQGGYGPKLTVPDMSMSLPEILERFVRGQKLSIGKEGVYHESEDDLEKVSRGDLTERAEFVERQKEVQERFNAQERKKEQERVKRVREKEREAIREEERAKAAQAPQGGAPSS